MGDVRQLDRNKGGSSDPELLRKLLADIDDRKPLAARAKGDTRDFFKSFDDRLSVKDRMSAVEAETHEISWLSQRRDVAEKGLAPEKKDELRRARRDYSCAKDEGGRAKCAKQIDDLVPGAGDLNKKIRGSLNYLDTLNTRIETPDPQACMRCHPRQNAPMYDPLEGARGSAHANLDRFYMPKREDEFEAKWAQIALESPVVKVNEALRQMPAMKVTSEDPVKAVKMALTIAGVDLTGGTSAMIEKAVGGLESISKEGGNKFRISRANTVDLPFPDKRDVGAGITLQSLEIGSIEFTLGEGKYPELSNIKGLKVKLDVPRAVAVLGQIDSEAQVKRIFMTRNEGSGDFQLNVEVNSPVPIATRVLAKQIISDKIPNTATIIVPVATIGPDGKLR